jgi:RNA polymerase sigma-70 factor (ECF subfamily)
MLAATGLAAACPPPPLRSRQASARVARARADPEILRKIGKKHGGANKYQVVTLTDFDLDALHDGGPPLEEWYARYAPSLFGYVARRLGRSLAEDITAQVFVEAIASYHRYDPARGTAKTWLFAIATNLVRSHLRREQRTLELFARTGVDPTADDPMRAADARLFAADQWPQLAAGLAELDPVDRDILLLYCFAELDYQEIAAALELPVGTVSSKMSRLRRKLRARLGDRSEGGSR